MKKTILALTLVGCGAVAGAQDSLKTNASMQTMNGNTQNPMELQTQTSVGSYNAYGTAVNVPSYTQSYLMRDYPTATGATWQQSGDWYRANVIDANRNVQMYYAPNGDNYRVVLPVVNSWVPEEVVTSALNMYGTSIYSVNRVKGVNGQELYAVTVLDNGVSRMEYLGADGATVATTDVFRTADMQTDAAAGSWNTTSDNAAMNNTTTVDGSTMSSEEGMSTTTSTGMSTESGTKMKSKVKNADGSEIKIKTKDGKTKIKETPAPSGSMQ